MSPRAYLLTFVGLLALTLLTFGLSFASLGAVAVPIAMVIAAAKACLIAMVFMGLREHGFADTSAMLVGILLAGLLVGFATVDVVTRDPPPRAFPSSTSPGHR